MMGGGGPTWVETFATTLTTNGGSWAGGYTTRIVIPASALMEASQVRITLRGNSGADFTVQEAAFGIAATSGDAYDFDATPIGVTVGGLSTFVIPAGSEVVTDPITISVPTARGAVFAFYATSGAARYVSAPTGWDSWYKSGNSVTTVDTTMDGSEPRLYFVGRIECLAP